MQPKPREKTKGERKLLEKDISSSQIKVPSTDSSSLSKTSSTASASSASTPSLFSSVSSIIDTSEVDKIISSLPIADKYALLIQSYAGKILESSANTADGEKNDRDLLKKIELLYSEMILRSISPEKKSIQNMIDSSSSFGNVELFSKTLKLLKKGGNVRGFGVAVGQLTSPIFKDLNSTFFSTALPSDEREKEVTYAISAIVFTFNWIGFQFVDFFVQDVSIYNTIISLLLGALLLYDVVSRKSEEIKMTVAGFERLLFRDNARQAFLDACSFVGGYLLGLPSYCYTSGVNEGLKMIETHPYSLQIYRQPSLLSSSLLNDLKKTFTSSFGNIDDKKRKGSNSLTSEEQFQKIVQQFKIRLAIGDKPDSLNVDLQSPASAVKSDSTNVKRLSGKEMVMMDALIENSLYDYLWEEEDRKFALGRILIWLMIPVAAETAKYGQTMLSDPARGKKFLDSVLTILKSKKIPVDSFLQSTYASTATSYSFTSSNEVITKSSIEFSKIAELLPQNEKDQKALLEWAYYEASAMLRQYGELFEDIHDYLKTGTSTVGECTLLIEEKL